MKGNNSAGKHINMFNLLLRFAIILVCVVIIVASFLSMSAAGNTFVIKDGDKTIVYDSYTSEPHEVISEVGIILGEADSYTTVHSGHYINIDILRNQTVTVNYNDSTYLVNTYGETVSSIIGKLRLPVDDDDIISCDLRESTFDGMVVDITTVNTITEYVTEESEIPFETVNEENSSLEKGTTLTVTEGANGLKETTYRRVYVNGQLTEETIDSEEITLEPVTEVIQYGTKEISRSSSKTTQSSSGSSSNSGNSSNSGSSGSSASSGSYADSNGYGVVSNEGGSITLPDGTTINYSQVLSMKATAYTTENWSNKITASGEIAQVGIVAVDRSVIPLGTKLYIVSKYGTWCYGLATAGDTGVKGYKVDLFFDTYDECISFGVKDAIVYIVD